MESSSHSPTHEQNPSSPLFSLFPLVPSTPQPNPNISNNDPQWLSNPSFTPTIFSVTAALPVQSPSSDEDDQPPPLPPSYDLVGSTDSEGLKRKEERRRRKKKKRKRDVSRRPEDRGWAGSAVTKPSKDYYFDVRGDRDNLVYGSLYRMDVARYRIQNQSELPGSFQHLRWRLSNSSMDVEGDVDLLDKKLRTGGRYCSVKYSTLERHKDLKHVKIVNNKMSSVVPGEYIPILEWSPDNGSNLPAAEEDIEESWDDEVVRRTRELNKTSRDFPHDEKVWLAFAEFQDKIASTQRQKAARLQTLEKKISILEKAVDLNPDNEELLLCLLKSYQKRESSVVLMEKWEKVLVQHSDSVTLWREFLLVCQGEFSQFNVSDMRRTYAHAIQALSSACDQLCRQGRSTDPSLVQLELGVVDIFISLCRFEWQTGYQELATGLFQAEIEYCLFCPSLLLSSQSKRRLFEHFWNAGDARIGEDGALGWSAWLENVEQKKHKTSGEEFLQETEVGGWTGWSDPLSKKIALGEHSENLQNALDDGDTEENLDDEGVQPNDDIESLLKKLGVNVDAEPHSEIKDAKTWNRWAEEELSRDSEQWRPVHEHSGNPGNLWSPRKEDNQDVEGNEQLSSVILFEDVNDYLFTLCSEEAHFSLVSQFIDFYGGNISRWTCTNNPSWIEKLQSLETVPDSFSEDLRVIFEMANTTHSSPVYPNLELLLGGIDKFSRNIDVMKFLRNAILLLLNVFPRNHILEEALLAAEESSFTKMDSSTCAVNPSRALAKSLLKNDRQDLLLCGVYARSEAKYKNVDIARKIFDMALSSTDGLPPDLKEYVPLLYFWYAEMEMEICRSKNSSESEQRAIHILSCLGGSTKYSPFKCQPSGFQILKAHQGFKEQIKGLRSSRGDIKEYSVALICTASLFEALTSGLAASIEVMEEVFSMALPERRNGSLQLESLWIYYIGMLQKHIKQLSFSRVFVKFEHGLQLYPYNPKSFISMVEISSLYTVPHKVRRLFDEYIRRKPSVVAWLVALSFELSKPGSQHRIHGLFEKALANNNKLQKSVLLWRFYLAYEADLAHNPSAARRVFFRAIHACPWSKRLWLDGFQKLSSVLTANELSDLQEVMRDKELNLRTDIYEILLQDGT